MKKILFSLTLTLLSLLSFSQFSTIYVNEKTENNKIVTSTNYSDSINKNNYDSLTNLCFQKKPELYKKYIGQKILFYPRAENSDINVNYYGNFFNILTPDTIWTKPKKNIDSNNYVLKPKISDKYKYTIVEQQKVCFGNLETIDYSNLETGYYTPKDVIEGHTFTIIDFNFSNNHKTNNIFITLEFTLLSEENEKLIWKIKNFMGDYEVFPVVSVGYCQKIKKQFVGMTFYKKSELSILYGIDLKNNGELKEIDGMLKCTDLSFINIKNNFKVPCLIFEDTLSNKYAIRITNTPDLQPYLERGNHYYKTNKDIFNPNLFISSNEYDKLKLLEEEKRKEKEKKLIEEERKRLENNRLIQIQSEKKKQSLIKLYGKTQAELILKGYVRIGMSKQMCIESWGEPKNINKTTGNYGIHEQWVYENDSYLYFENGKLTTIQN